LLDLGLRLLLIAAFLFQLADAGFKLFDFLIFFLQHVLHDLANMFVIVGRAVGRRLYC